MGKSIYTNSLKSFYAFLYFSFTIYFHINVDLLHSSYVYKLDKAANLFF